MTLLHSNLEGLGPLWRWQPVGRTPMFFGDLEAAAFSLGPFNPKLDLARLNVPLLHQERAAEFEDRQVAHLHDEVRLSSLG